jgi:hypothetical protein
VLAEDLHIAAELVREVVEQRLERPADRTVVRVAVRLEPRPRVVGLEAGEPVERLGREAAEAAQ